MIVKCPTCDNVMTEASEHDHYRCCFCNTYLNQAIVAAYVDKRDKDSLEESHVAVLGYN